jgi:hypothetical protein
MNGVTFHYYAVRNYRALLAEHGFALLDIHDDPGVNTYFLARRPGSGFREGVMSITMSKGSVA